MNNLYRDLAPITEAQRRFRDAWLSSGARNTF